jgi:hypothetical protein
MIILAVKMLEREGHLIDALIWKKNRFARSGAMNVVEFREL